MSSHRSHPLPARRLLYVDDFLCAVDKPSGLLSQEAPGRAPRRTILVQTAALLASRGERAELHAVHRLDEDTSGVLVFARDRDILARLKKTFRRHDVERVYHAIVLGAPDPPEGRLESLLRDGGERVEIVTRGGQPAITDYVTLATFAGRSVVACRLDTGRRNQIRVQLADIGHPVQGDRRYGRNHPGFSRFKARRTMLHATALGLRHPKHGKALRFIAPFPDDFSAQLPEGLAERLSAG
ncbi:MAG: hypothetical protein CMJ85_04260 [Planctomycetes bacterium]|jgi:23S rRNA pseudouridine1911/1915/1917 synthase|nr:hypothetical protein [Planctomycetota bacterium]